jgi:class III poly(R)-hydroxyalkanoic acid synthase PhaE subunit
MSDNKSLNEWMKDWDALQRQYFNAWSDLAQKAPFPVPPMAPAGFPTGNPFTASAPPSFAFPGFSAFAGMGAAAPAPGASWHEGLEQWMRMFAGTDKQSETADRLIDSAKTYVAMMQSMFGSAQQGAETAANPAPSWFDSMRGGFGVPGSSNMAGFDAATNPFIKALRDVAGKGAHGFAELPAAFAPYLDQLRNESLSWLRMPAFGIGREHQEHYQQTALAFVEYERALREYNRLMLKASQRGFELFERRLADHAEPGRTIDSLKSLYDLWVDAAEDAYAEIALSEEFSKVYGELANAQMGLRKQIQTQVERVSREFGMPTRSEVDGLGKRVHDLGRELRKGGAVARDDAGLEEKFTALRAEIAQLKKSLAPTAPSGSATRQTRKLAAQAAVEEPAKSAPKKPRAQKRAEKKTASGARSAARSAVSKPRAPAAVVRPRPVVEAEGESEAKVASFADAVAAMQRRVARKPKLRSAAAQLSRPSRQHHAKADKKRGKKGN